jgi:hypothetical protein
VHEQVAQIPAGKKGALVIVLEHHEGRPATVSFGTAAKLGDNWAVSLNLEQQLRKTSPTFTVAIAGSW